MSFSTLITPVLKNVYTNFGLFVLRTFSR